jgi:hypothetical protein
MLELGLIKTFNNISAHPSDDTIIKQNNMSVKDYKMKVNNLYGHVN